MASARFNLSTALKRANKAGLKNRPRRGSFRGSVSEDAEVLGWLDPAICPARFWRWIASRS
jgi:hypothetical protein